MPRIQDEILKDFFAELEKTEGFSPDRVQQFRQLLTGPKKPKAADVVKVLSDPTKEELP